MRREVRKVDVVVGVVAVLAAMVGAALSLDPVAATHGANDLGMPFESVVLPGNINNAGEVVSGGDKVFFLGSGGSWQPVGPGTGFDWIWAQYEHNARSLNSWGQVAGSMEIDFGVWHAFRWTVQGGTQDLGTLAIHPPPFDMSNAYVSNEAGWILGDSWTVDANPPLHGFVWVPPANTWSWPPLPNVPTGMHDLGVLPGGDFSTAWDMNDLGQIVGFSGIEADYRTVAYPPPVVWEFSPDGTTVIMTQINMGNEGSPLPGDYVNLDINNLGHVVTNGRDPATGDSTILRWTSPSSGASPENLGLPQSSTCPGMSDAILELATNDRGQILAEVSITSTVCPDLFSQSFVWTPDAGWIEIPTNGVGFSHGAAINNAGQVVGFEEDNGEWEPFEWLPTTGKEFLPPGPPCGSGHLGKALAINDVGQVAGVRGSADNPCALTTALWQRDADGIADLIDLVPDTECVEGSNCAFDDKPGGSFYSPFCCSGANDGTTEGTIVSRGGNKVAIVDVPPSTAPDHGVKIYNFGGGWGPAKFKTCGSTTPNFNVTASEGGAILTCGSLRLAVGAGEWMIEVPGNPVVVSAGAAVTLEEVGPGTLSITCDPESVGTVTVGGTPLNPGDTIVVTTNAAPGVAITGPDPGTVVAVGAPVTFDGAFVDDIGDTHTAEWTFGSTTIPGTVTESDGGGTVTDSYAFLEPGVYPVTLTVTDDGGASGTADTLGDLPAFVVVYDPDGGFVTGGGWFDSSPGSFAPDPSLTGKASFGFVAKYQNGKSLPSGETEFQFKVADLNFHSTSYDWLVCGGPKCQFKGHGTVNGVGGYSFLLTAIDGQLPGGGGEDKLRMKIWVTLTEQIVYDNQLGADDFADPTTVIGGGSIVIHKG